MLINFYKKSLEMQFGIQIIQKSTAILAKDFNEGL